MKRKKWSALLFCLCFLLVVLSGCGAAADETQPVENDENSVQVAEDSVYITLYMPAENSQEEQGNGQSEEEAITTTMVTAVAEDALSVETIVAEYNQLVVESLCGNTFVVNEVKEDNHKAWVDFDSASLQALELQQGSEGMLFYNLARSIDENLGDIDEIYFTMDGNQDFQLGHLWFEASRPFYSGMIPSENEDNAGSIGPE